MLEDSLVSDLDPFFLSVLSALTLSLSVFGPVKIASLLVVFESETSQISEQVSSLWCFIVITEKKQKRSVFNRRPLFLVFISCHTFSCDGSVPLSVRRFLLKQQKQMKIAEKNTADRTKP